MHQIDPDGALRAQYFRILALIGLVMTKVKIEPIFRLLYALRPFNPRVRASQIPLLESGTPLTIYVEHTSEEVTLSTCGEDLHENTHSTDHVEWSDWPVEENWTNKPYPTPIAPPPPFVTLTDLSIITQVVSYFLTVLQMLRRTMGDIKTPQDELEVASNTLTENYYKMRREVDPIAAKYCPNTYWLHPSSLRTPHSASIETWEGVRDVFMPPDMLSRLPSCPRCQRPGVCVASCEPLSRRSFAASMLEREKAVGVDPSDLFDEVREDESF